MTFNTHVFGDKVVVIRVGGVDSSATLKRSVMNEDDFSANRSGDLEWIDDASHDR